MDQNLAGEAFEGHNCHNIYELLAGQFPCHMDKEKKKRWQ